MMEMLHIKINCILSAAVMLVMAAACTIDNERSAFSNINKEGWAYNDTIFLDFSPSDSAQLANQPVDLLVALRHAADYEYSNIWLELSYPSADTILVDTIGIRLADEFGRWRGRGIGVGFQYVDTVLRDVQLNFSTPISIRHIMRADTLAGIEQAGIIITKR